MEAPSIRYVSTEDGVRIAYWKVGTGTPLVILPSLPHSHIGMEWELPEWRRGFEVGARRTLVRYDPRGTGLSQRPITAYSLETMLSDLDAVLGALGSETVSLYGFTNSCPVAIAYAVRHPARVSDLILWNPVVDGAIHRSNRQLEAARRIVEADWHTFSETVAHGLCGWSETKVARHFARLIRAGNDPDTFLSLVASLHELNVWDELPRIQCRTLVLHRPQATLLPPGTAERVAATIPDAQLVLFEGDSVVPFIGDWRAVLSVIESFLGITLLGSEGRPRGRALRLLRMRSDDLTSRERDVVALVAQGMTNRQIAEALSIAVKTVENHVSRVLVKLDLSGRTQIATYATDHGITQHTA